MPRRLPYIPLLPQSNGSPFSTLIQRLVAVLAPCRRWNGPCLGRHYGPPPRPRHGHGNGLG